MIEVEIKVCINNKERFIQELEKSGFVAGNLARETDWYFDNKEGTFRKSDKALRIRQCENLTSKENISYITFKGPKLDNISMTRKELEIRIEDAMTGKEILENLGFSPVLPVIKLRQYFHKGDMNACLDCVENLGDYLELEVVVEDESEREEALDRIFSFLYKLGYGKEDVIRTSYLSMLQKMQQKPMKTGAVIVAAGISGKNADLKNQIKNGDLLMAERVVLNFKRAGISDIVMVTGYQAKQLEKSLKDYGITFLRNEEFETTQMLDSVKMGFAYLKNVCDQVFLCPCDVPFFTTDTVEQLLMAEGSLIMPSHQGQIGHPIRMDTKLMKAVLKYNGDGGLKGAFESLGIEPVVIPLNDEGAVTDADSQEDYQHLVDLHDAGLMRPETKVRLVNKQPFFDGAAVNLLHLIDSLGSVKEACEKAGISYSKGWTILRTAEKELGYPIVERQPGGKNGGAAYVTDRGAKLIRLFEQFETEQAKLSQELYEGIFKECGLL